MGPSVIRFERSRRNVNVREQEQRLKVLIGALDCHQHSKLINLLQLGLWASEDLGKCRDKEVVELEEGRPAGILTRQAIVVV